MSLRSGSTRKDKTIYEEKTNLKGDIYYQPYHIGKHLGKGGFASCYEVTKPNDPKKYAVKIISKLAKGNDKVETLEKVHFVFCRSNWRSSSSQQWTAQELSSIFMILVTVRTCT